MCTQPQAGLRLGFPNHTRLQAGISMRLWRPRIDGAEGDSPWLSLKYRDS